VGAGPKGVELGEHSTLTGGDHKRFIIGGPNYNCNEMGSPCWIITYRRVDAEVRGFVQGRNVKYSGIICMDRAAATK